MWIFSSIRKYPNFFLKSFIDMADLIYCAKEFHTWTQCIFILNSRTLSLANGTADHLPVVYYIDEHFYFLQNIEKKWLEIFH